MRVCVICRKDLPRGVCPQCWNELTARNTRLNEDLYNWTVAHEELKVKHKRLQEKLTAANKALDEATAIIGGHLDGDDVTVQAGVWLARGNQDA